MSGTLPNWIAWLLGEEAGPGEGTAWELKHHLPWPAWVTLLLFAFAAVFAVVVYLNECRRASTRYRIMLATIRLALIAIVLAMIAQLTISLHRTGLPYVAVLVDPSESMTHRDAYDPEQLDVLRKRLEQIGSSEPSRWNLAKTLLERLHVRYDVVQIDGPGLEHLTAAEGQELPGQGGRPLSGLSDLLHVATRPVIRR